MGDNQITTTGTTGSSNPQVNSTLDSLLGQLNTAIGQGPPSNTGPGVNTIRGWQSALSSANNPALQNGLGGAMNYTSNLLHSGGLTGGQRNMMNLTSGLASRAGRPGLMEETMMGTARGNFLNGANPYFESNLMNAKDAAGAAVNSSIGAGGRFGSGAHVDRLGTTIGNLENSARGQQYEMERDHQLQAIQGIGGERQQGFNNQLGAAGTAFGMGQQGVNNVNSGADALASQFQSSLMPSSVIGAVGGAQDAFRDRSNNNFTDWLSRLSSIFGGTAPFGGTTSTTTQPGTPWWQTAVGGGLGLLGAFA